MNQHRKIQAQIWLWTILQNKVKDHISLAGLYVCKIDQWKIPKNKQLWNRFSSSHCTVFKRPVCSGFLFILNFMLGKEKCLVHVNSKWLVCAFFPHNFQFCLCSMSWSMSGPQSLLQASAPNHPFCWHSKPLSSQMSWEDSSSRTLIP